LEYLKKLEQEISKEKDRCGQDTTTREPIVITMLETKDRGRLFLLGEELVCNSPK